MAISKKFVVKNGLQTPSIDFVSTSSTGTITATKLDNGVLSFSGTSGQLFSIADSMTGTIFSVNDISGVPSIEVFDSGKIQLAETFGNVLVGTGTDNVYSKFQVNGGGYFNGIVTATNFYVGGWAVSTGTGTGTGSQLNTAQQNSNTNYFLTFVDSNNATSTAATANLNYSTNPPSCLLYTSPSPRD